MSSWDRHDEARQRALQDAALARQVTDHLAPASPHWRRVVRGAGLGASDVRTVADLRKVPTVGERDLCPDGNPAGAANLVLQLTESGYAVHAGGPALRRALRRRLMSPGAYTRQVQDAIRPVVYHVGGLDLPLPITSTREDLDVIARAGARAWRVLGLTADDVLVSVLPPDGSVSAMALPYAALGAGAPAVHAGVEGAALALAALPATVVAVTDAEALDALGVLPSSVRTVLVTEDDQDVAAIAGGARVLRVWGPPDGRWLYPECAEGGRETGLHTFPDLEVLETIDPATGATSAAGELVLTQLGVRGSALLRWRTGALHGGLSSGACPGCGRTVPRIGPDLRAGALVTDVQLGRGVGRLDLRAAAGAVSAHADLRGWRLRVQPDRAGGPPTVVLAVTPGGSGADPGSKAAADLAAAIEAEVAAVAGGTPTRVLVERGLTGAAIETPG